MFMTIRLALTGITLSLLAGCQTVEIEKPPTFERFSDIELNGPMPQAYREFVRNVDAYAAFYVTETGAGGGRIGGKSTLDEAKAGALAQCQEFNPDRDCILYATKTP